MMIRRWKENDIKSICRIEEESFPIPLTETQIIKEFRNPQAVYLVYEEGEALLGYGAFWQVVDEAQVMNIAVLPKLRSQGIGTAILSAMVEIAKEANLSLMTLEVRASNLPAIHLYEKFGFLAVGERKHYYRDNGETAILMEKRLGE